VTLMLHYPGNPAAGKAIDALVSHVDVFPTLCDLAGIPKPSHLQGVSLLPVISGDLAEVRNEVFSEVTFHAAYEPMRSIRTRQYKYIRRWSPFHYPLANCDSSPSKNLMRTMGWPADPQPSSELYDLAKDPLESKNVSGTEAYADIEVDLGTRLEAWMRETNDPLLQGPVPRPHDAIINRNTSEEPWHKDYEAD
jgi:N-sulfoglucosamine sulfohydrolase